MTFWKILFLILLTCPAVIFAEIISFYSDCEADSSADRCTSRSLPGGEKIRTHNLPEMFLLSHDFSAIAITEKSGAQVFQAELYEAGRANLERVTKQNLGRKLCTMVDDRLVTCLVITEVVNQGKFNISVPNGAKFYWSSIPWIQEASRNIMLSKAEKDQKWMNVYVALSSFFILASLAYAFYPEKEDL